MNKFLIPIAAAASTLAFAAPASAQAYGNLGPVYGAPGYGAPYGYGHRFNYGHARALQVRVDRIQREIVRMARFGMVSPREYRRLRNESRRIERAIRVNARDRFGMTPREAYRIERRIARLEQRVHYAGWNRGHRYGHRYGYGYGYRR